MSSAGAAARDDDPRDSRTEFSNESGVVLVRARRPTAGGVGTGTMGSSGLLRFVPMHGGPPSWDGVSS